MVVDPTLWSRPTPYTPLQSWLYHQSFLKNIRAGYRAAGMVALMFFKKGLLDWFITQKSYPAVMKHHRHSQGIQRPSQNWVWYCKAGTTDNSCCQQSFFSGPKLHRSPADPPRYQNHLQGEVTAEWTALWCYSGWNPNVRTLNLVFPSVPSLSQCILVFPSDY